jgi:two-component system nitrogen regulation sensor histidine kinase GlnL
MIVQNPTLSSVQEPAVPVGEPNAAAMLAALPNPIMLIDPENYVRYVNPAAESLFQVSASYLCGQPLDTIAPYGSPLIALVDQVRTESRWVSEYDVVLGTPKTETQTVNIQGTPVVEAPGHVLLSLHTHTIAQTMDRQLVHRNAVRSVYGIATVLAHEIKNPLSGIRGAAQLLEQGVSADDRPLTNLICAETDRICALVDSMEAFSDDRPIDRGAVNIHRVLDHVHDLAKNGVARKHRIVEHYDPSLPPVFGNRDQLIQVFLNLVKNAAEAMPDPGGEIILTTAYRPGVRLAVPGTGDRVQLPLEVTVQDDGKGVPEDLLPNLFDPFVTTKSDGTGLGLALVAKIINDHGGTIECESRPRRTVFRVRLPLHQV